jgi:hypothetical protein
MKSIARERLKHDPAEWGEPPRKCSNEEYRERAIETQPLISTLSTSRDIAQEGSQGTASALGTCGIAAAQLDNVELKTRKRINKAVRDLLEGWMSRRSQPYTALHTGSGAAG